jgi:hypothetical protein
MEVCLSAIKPMMDGTKQRNHVNRTIRHKKDIISDFYSIRQADSLSGDMEV